MSMRIDVVIPFYNEQDCARQILQRLIAELDQLQDVTCSYYLVDDGSADRTSAILDEMMMADSRIQVIHLWGNHGHQKALVAGLDQCHGDAVLMLDGDGQHPADVAADLVRKLIEHPEIAVIQTIRRGSQGGRFKDWASRFYYQAVNFLLNGQKLMGGASDFRIIRRDVLNLLKRYPDRYRNLRVLLSSLPLPTIYVEFTVPDRIAGKSKYSWPKMIQLACDGLFAFSSLPLRLSLLLMFGTGAFGISYSLYGLFVYFQGSVVSGWTSIIALTSLLFCGVFAVLAIYGEYIKRIYEDVRQHPVYTLRPSAGEGSSNNRYRPEETESGVSSKSV